MPDFVGLGFCSNDFLSVVPEIPIDKKVQILEHLVQGGGPAATATVAAARLGVSASFISVVGDDGPGKTILSDFAKEQVGTESMIVRPGESSPVAYCWIDAPTAKRSIAWTRGTLGELTAAEVDLALVRQAKVLHLDGHNPVGALAAAKEAKAHGVLVSLDAGTLRDGVPELLPYVDLLIASEQFARQLTGESDPVAALPKLASYGARVAGVTMGDQGSAALCDGKVYRCPAFSMKAVDTTGCGDVYHGAFAAKYLETQDTLECMRFASAVSALKCLKLGGRAGIPTRDQVNEFLKQH